MIRVKALTIYPIKGMEGTLVSSSKVLERGFEHDRRYMLIDASNTFISQRTHPQLVHLKPKINGDQLKITYQDEELTFSMIENLGNRIITNLFEHKVQATEVSLIVNKWFTDILGERVRLVKMLDNDIRYKKLVKGPDQVEVSFADGYPYLVLGDSSVDELNSRLDEPIKANRFRANIYLETSEPHIEDYWETIRIGNVDFLVVKPCARCQVITVNQETGFRSKEPLKTLSTYRKIDNKVFFGANAICRGEGEVHIGDEVVIL